MYSRTISLVIILFLASWVARPAAAAPEVPPVSLSTAALEITAVKDHGTPGASFRLTANQPGLTAIDLSITPLRLVAGESLQKAIQSSDVVITPKDIASPPAGVGQEIALVFSNVTDAGIWRGDLTVAWRGVFTGSQTIPVTLTMQTVPALQLDSPPSLLVQGTSADSSLIREVSLRETGAGSPAAGLKIAPPVLYTADGKQTFPSQNITGTVAAVLEPTGSTVARFVFDLRGVPRGSYSGNLVVQSDRAPDVLIPVTVAVKDPFAGALFWLGLGVGASLLLTLYRTSIHPKDLLRARLQSLGDFLKQDETFAEYCGPQFVHQQVALAEQAIFKNNQPEANSTLEAAEALWFGWKKNGLQLLGHIKNVKELLAMLAADVGEIQTWPAAQVLQKAMQDAVEKNIPQYVGQPDALRSLIEQPETGWKPTLEWLLTLAENLPAVRTALAGASGLSAAQRQALQHKLGGIVGEIEAFEALPTVSALKTLQGKLAALLEEIQQAVEQGSQQQDLYTSCAAEARNLLQLLEDDAGDHILAAADFIQQTILSQAESRFQCGETLNASRVAQNAYRAAQSCAFLQRSAKSRQGKTEAPWDVALQKEKNLVNWLTGERIYLDTEPAVFLQTLDGKVLELKTALDAAGQFLPVSWGDLPAPATKSLESNLEAFRRWFPMLRLPEEIRLAQVPQAAGPQSEPLWWHIWMLAWWTPKRRLAAFQIASFVIIVGLLTVLGIKELYVDQPAFGENGWWDYAKLFWWGFGGEASRASLLGVAQNWGFDTASGKLGNG